MVKPILYSQVLLPPVRAVRLTAAAINLELDIRSVLYLKDVWQKKNK